MAIGFSIGNFTFDVQAADEIKIISDNIDDFRHIPTNSNQINISLRFQISDSMPQNLGEELFVAESKDELYFQNIWKVHQYKDIISYSVIYSNHPELESAYFTYHENRRMVDVFLKPKENITTLSINPFTHPFGVLILTRLQQVHGGFLIHGSGVKDGDNGYIFTGVSGMGKSTMAWLWHSLGAEIVNDDRLLISKTEQGYSFYNTPMPHYNDFAKSAALKAIFLLSQSPINYCTKIGGVKALSKVMANFMQQFFDPKIIAIHLDRTENLISEIPVYELGFKPDTDVVALVRNLKL